MVVIEGHAEGREIGRMGLLHAGDEGFRGNACLLGGQHDRRAVGVVGADVSHLIAAHALEAHPDVGLDVADHVAEVQRAVGVGQRVGDENLSGGHDARAA